jgi:hypothetical protein
MVCAVWGSRSMVAVVSELSRYFSPEPMSGLGPNQRTYEIEEQARKAS